MARIYQSEKVLMKEVGLIKKANIIVTKVEIIETEGTEKELIAKCKELQSLPHVKIVEGRYI